MLFVSSIFAICNMKFFNRSTAMPQNDGYAATHAFTVVGACSSCLQNIVMVVNAPLLSAAQAIGLGASCTVCVAGTVNYTVSSSL